MSGEKKNTQLVENLFGTRLRQIRTDHGWTQEEFAEKISIGDQVMISAWENGRLPRIEHLFDLCKRLSISADYLLGLSDEPSLFEEGGGLKWNITRPPSGTIYAIDDVEDGITLFQQIVQKKKHPRDIDLEANPFARSEAALRRLIRNVLMSGIIRVVDVERDQALEEQLGERYNNLKECIVAKLDIPADSIIDHTIRTEAIAFLAARDSSREIQGVSSVGLAGGGIVSRWVDLVQPILPKLAGVRWISLVGTAGIEVPPGNTANAVVGRLAHMQPGISGYRMPFVNADRRRDEYFQKAQNLELDELKDARKVLWYAQNVEAVLMSVGSPETNYSVPTPEHPLARVLQQMPAKERDKCVGDILLRLIDKDGQRVGTPKDKDNNDAIVYSIGLDDLSRISKRGLVWIVAGHAQKSACIHAALRSGLANCLVVESTVAETLLNESFSK